MSYAAAGWMQWPAHPEVSAQFIRVLGVAQEGGAAISECFLVAGEIDPVQPESWHAAWLARARRNRDAADAAHAAGHVETALANWLRATTYYRASEVLLAPEDARRTTVFAEMLVCAQAFVKRLTPAGQVLQITAADGTFADAYFVKPQGEGPWPCVVCVAGMDGSKEELLPRLLRPWLARGLAMLLIDLPGQGSALRQRATPNRADTEVVVSACVDYLCGRPDVDSGRIAMYGASLGGVYASRAASREPRFKALVADSLIFDLHAAFMQRLQAEDAQGIRGDWAMLKWVFGCPTPEAVVDKSLQFRMAGFIGGISAPWLIVQGEHDFLGLQTAVDAFDFARAQGVKAELKVFTAQETGAAHCQADNPTLGQEFIGDWLRERL